MAWAAGRIKRMDTGRPPARELRLSGGRPLLRQKQVVVFVDECGFGCAGHPPARNDTKPSTDAQRAARIKSLQLYVQRGQYATTCQAGITWCFCCPLRRTLPPETLTDSTPNPSAEPSCDLSRIRVSGMVSLRLAPCAGSRPRVAPLEARGDHMARRVISDISVRTDPSLPQPSLRVPFTSQTAWTAAGEAAPPCRPLPSGEAGPFR